MNKTAWKKFFPSASRWMAYLFLLWTERYSIRIYWPGAVGTGLNIIGKGEKRKEKMSNGWCMAFTSCQWNYFTSFLRVFPPYSEWTTSMWSAVDFCFCISLGIISTSSSFRISALISSGTIVLGNRKHLWNAPLLLSRKRELYGVWSSGSAISRTPDMQIVRSSSGVTFSDSLFTWGRLAASR